MLTRVFSEWINIFEKGYVSIKYFFVKKLLAALTLNWVGEEMAPFVTKFL